MNKFFNFLAASNRYKHQQEASSYAAISSSLNSSLTMDAKEIQKRIVRLKDDIEREVRDRLPRKVGIVAVNHFKQNFRDAGWRDDGLHPWKTTRRQREGGPDAQVHAAHFAP